MSNKTQLITPFLMLTAGTIASVIMYVRGFDFNKMLWDLLIVLVIFYIIGDIARYIYATIKPRIIPASNIDDEMISALMHADDAAGNVVAVADIENADMGGDFTQEPGADGFMSENGAGYSDEDGYSDEELGGYGGDDASSYGSDDDNDEY